MQVIVACDATESVVLQRGGKGSPAYEQTYCLGDHLSNKYKILAVKNSDLDAPILNN